MIYWLEWVAWTRTGRAKLRHPCGVLTGSGAANSEVRGEHVIQGLSLCCSHIWMPQVHAQNDSGSRFWGAFKDTKTVFMGGFIKLNWTDNVFAGCYLHTLVRDGMKEWIIKKEAVPLWPTLRLPSHHQLTRWWSLQTCGSEFYVVVWLPVWQFTELSHLFSKLRGLLSDGWKHKMDNREINLNLLLMHF